MATVAAPVTITLVSGRAWVISYLARVLQFPSHYGRNLDALYDLLTEVGQTLEIEISHVDEIKSQLGIYGSTLLQTFQEAENDNLSLTVTLV